jgi:transposase-like protein
MAQHFLLSAAARTLSLKDIYEGGEEAAYRRLCLLRWSATNGKPVCPRCGWTEAYHLSSRRKYKCKACHHQFSLTSGTIFASRKLAFVDLLGAIALFVNAAKGMSALQLSRCIDVSYKTAFVLAHKLREALTSTTQAILLGNTVEVDGAYSGGHVRPANARLDRVDRRRRTYRRPERRSVIVLRQRGGRTLTGVFERESDGVAFARSRIKPNARIVADETPHWDLLSGTFELERINHSDAYSFFDGVHVNGAESYFSRLRRMIRGQHHHVSPAYLASYATHAAWLEDHRRHSNGALVEAVIGNGFAAPVSRLWKGYWRRAE